MLVAVVTWLRDRLHAATLQAAIAEERPARAYFRRRRAIALPSAPPVLLSRGAAAGVAAGGLPVVPFAPKSAKRLRGARGAVAWAAPDGQPDNGSLAG
jgi:hypothetical protein